MPFCKIPYILCALTLIALPLQAGLVTNGDFETGDFTGWTQSGNTTFTGVTGAPCPGLPSTADCTPFTGSVAAFFGPSTPGTITQNIPTIAGVLYDLDFFVDLQAGFSFPGTPNEFKVQWDGITLIDVIDTAVIPWQQMTFNGLAASSSSTPLAFTFTDQPNWIGLDDVNVVAEATAAPEPGTVVLLGLGLVAAYVRRRFTSSRASRIPK